MPHPLRAACPTTHHPLPMQLAQVQYEPSAGSPGSSLNGALAASFMATVLTAGLLLTSFFVLVKKSVARSGADFRCGT